MLYEDMLTQSIQNIQCDSKNIRGKGNEPVGTENK